MGRAQDTREAAAITTTTGVNLKTDGDDGASAASTTEALTASDQGRRRRNRIRLRDKRTSASLSSSRELRSSGRNRHRRHAWQRVVPFGRALIGDQRSALEGLGRLAAMRAWGGRAARPAPFTRGWGDARAGRRRTRLVRPLVVGTTARARARQRATPLKGMDARWQRGASPVTDGS